MARSFSRSAAFLAYGVRLRNPMTDWSGISADGSMVAASLWRDEFRGLAGAMVYEKSDTNDWVGPGKRALFQHLRYALDHCGGIVRVVVSVRDLSNCARVIDCYPAPNLLMRITYLDEMSGAFRLEQFLAVENAA